MRVDLEKYKKLAQITKDVATYYAPFTPLHQYRREELIQLPQIKSEIIDLKKFAHSDQEGHEPFLKRIKELELANLDL